MAFRGFPAGGGAAERVGYSPATKMKRKDPEEVYDAFSESSLWSPARKTRRLDAEFPPVVLEEEEPTLFPRVFGHSVPELQPQPQPQPQQQSQHLAAGWAEVGSPVACNEDRAIVLYNPVARAPPSSSVSFIVDPDVIAGLKNMFWSGQRKLVKAMEERAGASDDDREAAISSCLAVVPWVQSQMPENTNLMNEEPAAPVGLAEVPMESEDVEGVSMDVDDEGGVATAAVAPGMSSGGLQHCIMAPQTIRPSPLSPIMWSWGQREATGRLTPGGDFCQPGGARDKALT